MLTFYIVSYDIVNNDRRNRVARILEGYGDRRQKSVFECHLKEAHWKALWEKLEQTIDADEDTVLCYELCRTCVAKVKKLGLIDPVLTEPAYFMA